MTVAERFWSKVGIRGPDECWEWQGSRFNSGYGAFWRGKNNALAHRTAYELTNGPLPPGEGHHGTVVRHRCDNKVCCNPAHLEPGTMADNNRDKMERGRHRAARGAENGKAKLTEAAVRDIKRRHRPGLTPTLACEYGVSRTCIDDIVSGRRWSHV